MVIMMKFNVLEHGMVPQHTLIPVKDEKDIIKLLEIGGKNALPKIKKTDPVLKILSKIEGPIKAGRLIKIVRKSSTAGQIVGYRMVSEE